MTATSQLLELREDILSRIPDAYLFPEHAGVRGFLGCGPVMLVGERLSTGRFPSPADQLLYSLLQKYGAADAHLTDVIKSRANARAPYPSDMTIHRRLFDRELEIVQPSVIITFGAKVHDLLRFAFAGAHVEIRQIWHYSYARRWPSKTEAFEEQLRDALA